MKHLREAGLGDMADRLEHAIAGRGHDRRGPQRDFASRRPMNTPRDGEAGAPQHHHRWSEQARREGGAFAMPQRVPNLRPDAARGSDQRRDGNAGAEELRSQLQRLTREVEQLKQMMKQRTSDSPGEQIRRPDEPKREERRADGPRQEERRDGPPGPSREERRGN
ncbi:MAG: hypothetical protein ACAH88_05650 [Roseimicrobium sp.]